jgi:hypothetical protein
VPGPCRQISRDLLVLNILGRQFGGATAGGWWGVQTQFCAPRQWFDEVSVEVVVALVAVARCDLHRDRRRRGVTHGQHGRQLDDMHGAEPAQNTRCKLSHGRVERWWNDGSQNHEALYTLLLARHRTAPIRLASPWSRSRSPNLSAGYALENFAEQSGIASARVDSLIRTCFLADTTSDDRTRT